MFALLLPSRPLQSATTLSPTQYAFTVPSQPAFSHLAIFLLPDATLPPDAGATIWIQLPNTAFRLLGALGPSKPSAIFRLRSSGPQADTEGDVMLDDSSTSAAPRASEVVIGVQIEPAARVQEQLETLRAQQQQRPAQAKPKVDTKVLAQRIIGNAFNFLSSFGSETIPLKAFQDWWRKFESKIELDPGFLEREQD
ncbi:hypothetical protein ANO11243_081650 [Dothideomycetidae sp. 11243]|nr:hypothetical protein ANO11243_081650 [fungal sp. No.11243]